MKIKALHRLFPLFASVEMDGFSQRRIACRKAVVNLRA